MVVWPATGESDRRGQRGHWGKGEGEGEGEEKKNMRKVEAGKKGLERDRENVNTV